MAEFRLGLATATVRDDFTIIGVRAAGPERPCAVSFGIGQFQGAADRVRDLKF